MAVYLVPTKATVLHAVAADTCKPRFFAARHHSLLYRSLYHVTVNPSVRLPVYPSHSGTASNKKLTTEKKRVIMFFLGWLTHLEIH